MENWQTWEETFASLPLHPAECVYGIAFTPRSGSTWLGQVIAASGILGDPREYFNQRAANFTVAHSACKNVWQYYNYIKTVKQSDGVFGFEIAYFHLSRLLQEGYESLFNDVVTWLYLRRRDYIAQAVSHYKANYTGVFHSTQKAGEQKEVPYDPAHIKRHALAIMAEEKRFLDFFHRLKVSPAELWYEDLLVLSDEDIVRTVVHSLGLESRFSDLAEKIKHMQKKPIWKNSPIRIVKP
ncbi:MAG: Stf0 family sulfotransferase [Halioglobus sp.]|nr:Stf0 family sulfotransferase [Halioglobus sp.]